jgi:hypothetical protein
MCVTLRILNLSGCGLTDLSVPSIVNIIKVSILNFVNIQNVIHVLILGLLILDDGVDSSYSQCNHCPGTALT